MSNFIYKASPQSSSLAPELNLSLPIWASWDWGQKYLSPDIHTGKFPLALDLLHKYTFVDQNEGTLIALGFGLLLRECWRAVEVEDDDETSPNFLKESLLDQKMANQVIKAIKEVIGTLPSSDIEEERQKEKELGDSAKGKKVRAGQKKQKVDNNPVEGTRSQRQRKPSKKLRDSN